MNGQSSQFVDSFKHEMIKTCLLLEKKGLNQGMSGNISLRLPEGYLVTPSGVPSGKLTKDNIIFINDAGEFYGDGKPSSEWPFHREIYKKKGDEVQVVLHSHSIHATAVSMHGKDLPACHYMIALFGGHTVPCASYALFGSEELSQNIVSVLDQRSACLIENHGVVVCGGSLNEAVYKLEELEVLCRQYLLSYQMGPPNILSQKQIQEVLDKVKRTGYGNSKD